MLRPCELGILPSPPPPVFAHGRLPVLGKAQWPAGWSVALGIWPHLPAPSELLLRDALMGSDRVPGVGRGAGGVRILVSGCDRVCVWSCCLSRCHGRTDGG